MNLPNGGEPGGLGGELYHLVPAGLVGPTALWVFTAPDTGLLVTEGEVPAADFRRLERGMGVTVDSVQIWSMSDSRFSWSTILTVSTLTVQTRCSRSITRSLWSAKR